MTWEKNSSGEDQGHDAGPRRITVPLSGGGGAPQPPATRLGGGTQRLNSPSHAARGGQTGRQVERPAPAPRNVGVNHVVARPHVAAQSSGYSTLLKNKYLLAGLGVLLLTVGALAALSKSSGKKCPGAVQLIGPKSEDLIERPFLVKADVENSRCVSYVTFQLDGVEVGRSEKAPYELALNPEKLPELPKKTKHELTVVVVEAGGKSTTAPEKLQLLFNVARPSAEEKTAEAKPTATASPTPTPTTATNVDPAQNEVRSLCQQLASQVSQKSGYTFSPEFIGLVQQRIAEYQNAQWWQGARTYRRDINKAYRDEGLEPLVGYILAFSRSKFNINASQGGLGLWRLSPGVIRASGYLSQNESEAVLKDPKRSAEIAAVYTKYLLNTFEKEDFMYAVACFGMSIREAGSFRAQLNSAVAADPTVRGDIVKMQKAGLLKDEQVDQIVRFFAAGVVGEHPQTFGVVSAQPFSAHFK